MSDGCKNFRTPGAKVCEYNSVSTRCQSIYTTSCTQVKYQQPVSGSALVAWQTIPISWPANVITIARIPFSIASPILHKMHS
jgi:hypothetical protein